MTFAARETSRALGAPIALFLFTYGPGAADVFAYTSAEEEVTYGGNTYLPVPIRNDTFSASGSLDKASFQLRLSKFLDIASLFTGFPPSQIVTLKIYESHVGDSEVKPVWFGRLLSYQIEGDEIVFTCEPVSSALRRSGLRRHYQRGCPHVLYGDQCRASRNAFTSTLIVQGVTSPFVSLVNGWSNALDSSKYLNGVAWWVNTAGRTEYRTIQKITSPTQMQLSGDCSTLAAGMSLKVAPGCNHLMSDCANVFSNIQNFGGHPWIPLKNPLGIVNNYV